EIDAALLERVQLVREEGGEVHIENLVAIARGLFRIHNQEDLLADRGGKLKLTDGWAKKWLDRKGFVKRSGTQAKHKAILTEEIRKDYLYRIANVVQVCLPLFHLIGTGVCNSEVFSDQHGRNRNKSAPAGNSTYAEKGSKQVPISSFEEKKQLTCSLA